MATLRQRFTSALVLTFVSSSMAFVAVPQPANAAAALPSIMITEMIPNAKNVKPPGATANYDEAYEMIELYNNSGQNVKLGDLQIIIRDGFTDKDKVNTPWNWGSDASNVIPPSGIMIVWIKQEKNPFSFDDFYKFYKEKNPDLKAEQIAVASGMGLVNTGKRTVIVAKADGTRISSASYEGSTTETVDDRAIQFAYPTDGSIDMRKIDSGKDSLSTPGKLSAQQVPPAPAKTVPNDKPADKTDAKPSLNAVEIAAKLGMLTGDGNGVTPEYLAKTPTRIQAAVMYLRLKGLEVEAAKFTDEDNFSDASSASWAIPILAYVKAHPELGMEGVGDNRFDPNTVISAQAYYKMMLEALGYKYGTDFSWEQTFDFAASIGLGKAASEVDFTMSELATATLEALMTKVKGSDKTLAQMLVEQKAISADVAKSIGLN
ncbi:hypothetical protein ACFQI7_09225 [Paenibacillus allorhizosphaerae]|uniref:S-layer homology domain-containing protein n=1 Tax=Paenibacillus allorhizosphaerae TaxID=2849866 RepID=A0ABN7TQZ3_9BACL|nr:hypothetical protein [Paenibacillus allorhizosphaerae]CAG7644106.1 hypothetical protein PAECIP111802_03156 [Paenibacillus allorhizosphaerae]